MPKTPLPPYDPLQPILRGHVVYVAKQAYKEKNKIIHSELWSKILLVSGIHVLQPVGLELLSSLSDGAMEYIKGALEHSARMARINQTKKEKRNGKSKRTKQAR
ncbi:MAG: hypothetical protein HRU05_00965 [Oceanospirillaceae bacterium]|nr:hypothetical protein [Oceanospirillaceae bacterium]